jgi:uncharacterized protein (TIGR02594 family)
LLHYFFIAVGGTTMQLSRRTTLGLLLGAVVTPVLSDEQDAFAPLAQLPPLPPEYQSIASERPMNQEFADAISVQGTAHPTSSQQAVADSIIHAVETLTNVSPLQVAAFMLDIARGNHGDEWRYYTRAWPIDAPANPLILNFFSATHTTPVGDTTAWCAAFMNWCMIKAHKGRVPAGGNPPTASAASSSFRRWGKAVYDPLSAGANSGSPQVGDLAVFQEVNSAGTVDPVHGHVAFFLDMDNNRVKVLGGNQFEGNPVVHAINVKWIPKTGRLQLHSIRTDRTLSKP